MGLYAPPMDEIWRNDLLTVFDGTILEFFGFIPTAKTESGARFHVRNLRCNVARSSNFGMVAEVSDEDGATVGPFVDRVSAAVAART